jgi:hypothetical protein
MKMEERANQSILQGQSNERMTITQVFDLFESAGAIQLGKEVWKMAATDANRYFTLPSTISNSTARGIGTYAALIETLCDIKRSGEIEG